MDLTIKNATLVLPETTIPNQDILCKDGKIIEITNSNNSQTHTGQTVNAAGLYLTPGFIDLHIHGTGDYIIDAGPDDLSEICKLLPKYGVTAFLPTLCAKPKGKDAEFLNTLSKIKTQNTQILGFHLEGPFLTLTGALPPDSLGPVDKDRVKALIEAAKPYKAIFSIAPDFKGIEQLIPIMSANDTPVFMTHTKADVKQTQKAIDLGARHATHFYDVFPCPIETDPGVRPCGAVEAILADETVSVDFILDGEHVDPVAVKMAMLCKGKDKVCLITDANIGAGREPGRYMSFGDTEVEFAYQGAPARMTENSPYPGSLAGSGLTMNLAVKNAIKLLGVDLPTAVRMASSNPARVLKIDKSKGQIKVGFDADMVLLDENIEVVQTFVAGKCCYKK
ncbi:N-acetylglucosamine-6-phosphate deacetylase [Planctomycetota bacterium]